MTKYSGGCACGAVRYETDADPIMAGHCQCRKCQTLSGAGHMTFAAFPAAAVKVTGQLVPWSYTADSGNTATVRGTPARPAPPVQPPSGVRLSSHNTSGMAAMMARNHNKDV